MSCCTTPSSMLCTGPCVANGPPHPPCWLEPPPGCPAAAAACPLRQGGGKARWAKQADSAAPKGLPASVWDACGCVAARAGPALMACLQNYVHGVESERWRQVAGGQSPPGDGKHRHITAQAPAPTAGAAHNSYVPNERKGNWGTFAAGLRTAGEDSGARIGVGGGH